MTQDLSEFTLANAIYAALVEAHACEQSARRNAMDNSSKNASDMINRLTMQYNRGRQAAITNELVDIITGEIAAFYGNVCGLLTDFLQVLLPSKYSVGGCSRCRVLRRWAFPVVCVPRFTIVLFQYRCTCLDIPWDAPK